MDYSKKTKSELIEIIKSLEKKANRGGGRSPSLSPSQVKKVLELHAEGKTITSIIKILDLTCSAMTVSRIIRKSKTEL